MRQLSLNLTHNRNLQQLHIDSPDTVVFNDFMTPVSVHGELVYVVMMVRCVRVRSLTSCEELSQTDNIIFACFSYGCGYRAC